MRPSRVLFPLLLALTLLFAQHAGVMHALSHTLAQQGQDWQDKQPSHYSACGQCAAYTQSGNALSGTVYFSPLTLGIAATVPGILVTYHSTRPFIFVARGPPPLFFPISA